MAKANSRSEGTSEFNEILTKARNPRLAKEYRDRKESERKAALVNKYNSMDAMSRYTWSIENPEGIQRGEETCRREVSMSGRKDYKYKVIRELQFVSEDNSFSDAERDYARKLGNNLVDKGEAEVKKIIYASFNDPQLYNVTKADGIRSSRKKRNREGHEGDNESPTRVQHEGWRDVCQVWR